MRRTTLLLALALSTPASTLFAQSGQDPLASLFASARHAAKLRAHTQPAMPDSLGPQPIHFGSWVRPAKWVSLGTAAGLAALGFVLKEQADDRFERLRSLCNQDPVNCRDRDSDGSYSDPQLESLFQEVLDRDAQARLSLIASNVSFAASVAFFIIDFQRDDGPGNIPYDPPSPDDGDPEDRGLELSLGPNALTLRYFIN